MHDDCTQALDEATVDGQGSDAKRDAPAVEALPPRESFAPGMLIAEKYAVERVVGEGGIGVVVAAKHVDLDQTVAIKYLRPKALASPNAAERFLREARLAARIRSEHIVRVYDVSRLADGTPYMVMEYLTGKDLGRILAAEGPLQVERAVDYILQACEALAEAHVAGIVHRDLKPDNLFVATGSAGKSVLKILDFGISKLSAKRTTPGSPSSITQAEDTFGTPVYMSPEQLRSSGDVDARADVWAIGVVLYELLTGRLPFDGDGLPELCTAILATPPAPLLTMRPNLPAELQTVLDRCLEKDREARYQNVAELAQELRPFASPTAHARVEHVVRIIQEGGERVRPPTPIPGAVSARPLHGAPTMPPSEGRSALTTGSSAASWGAVKRASKRAPWMRGPVLIPAAAAAAVFCVAALFGLYGKSADPPSSPAAVQTAPPVAAPLPPPAAPATVAVAPDVTTEPVPAAPEPSPSSSTAARPSGRAAAGKRTTSGNSSAKKPAPVPSSFDSTAVINPFD